MFRWVFLLAVCGPGAWAGAFEYAPKINVRLSNGLLTNQTGGKGSANTIAGLNLSALYFPGPKVAFGLGYQYHFDISTQALIFNGVDLMGRYYFIGEGTRVTSTDDATTSEFRRPLAAYGVTELSRRSFFVGSNTEEASGSPLSGDILNLNLGVGLDLPLARHLDFTVEANVSLLSFAASDNRFRIAAYLLHVGLSYLW